MASSAFVVILFRWLHLTTAAIAVGGVFYARIVLPIAERAAAAGDAGVAALLVRARRAFKMAVHTCVLFLLVSGTYNYWLNGPAYKHAGPAAQSLVGTHLLIGLVVLGLLVWLFVGREPRPSYLRWMAVSLGLMLVTIAVASTTKYAREHAAPLSTASAGVPVPG